VTDAQERLAARMQELDFEVHEVEFQVWAEFDKKPMAQQQPSSFPAAGRGEAFCRRSPAVGPARRLLQSAPTT